MAAHKNDWCPCCGRGKRQQRVDGRRFRVWARWLARKEQPKVIVNGVHVVAVVGGGGGRGVTLGGADGRGTTYGGGI